MSTNITDKALEADWLAVCRRSAERLASVFTEYPSTGERKVGVGRGAGGDQTLVIDHGAEDVVLAELDRLHAEGYEFTAISEERGVLPYGNGESAVRVVIDPIDGSLNAKRLLPTFALSIAVASGDSMEDVEFGFVHEFGTGDEFVARRDGGATLNGRPLVLEDPDGATLEVVGLESARPEWLLPVVEELVAKAYRLRVIGSIAASLCFVAAARFDGMASANVVPLCRCRRRPADRPRGGRLRQLPRVRGRRGAARSRRALSARGGPDAGGPGRAGASAHGRRRARRLTRGSRPCLSGSAIRSAICAALRTP